MAALNKFDTYAGDVAFSVHDFRAAGSTLRVYLTNATPSVSGDSVKADLAEISAGNGYTSGGEDAQNDCTKVGANAEVTGVDITWTASGGTIGPFRYAVLYNDTPTSPADPLIGYWDYGSAITLNDGEPFTTDFGATILTING